MFCFVSDYNILTTTNHLSYGIIVSMYWETKRKLLYAFAVIVALSGIIVFSIRDRIFPPPTCVDTIQNGYESGVDCGGGCALKCTQEVSPLSVVWSKAVRSGQNIYDLVALVSNANIDNASREVGYTFTLYNNGGQIIGQLSGSTTAPLDGKFPLIIQNVPISTPPASVMVALHDGPHYSVRESPSSPTIRVPKRRFENGTTPRVYATLLNTKRIEITNLPVRVLLYDEKDNVYAIGQTIVPSIGKEGMKEVVFTWNESLPVAPTRIEVYPFFNPFDAIGY